MGNIFLSKGRSVEAGWNSISFKRKYGRIKGKGQGNTMLIYKLTFLGYSYKKRFNRTPERRGKYLVYMIISSPKFDLWDQKHCQLSWGDYDVAFPTLCVIMGGDSLFRSKISECLQDALIPERPLWLIIWYFSVLVTLLQEKQRKYMNVLKPAFVEICG